MRTIGEAHPSRRAEDGAPQDEGCGELSPFRRRLLGLLHRRLGLHLAARGRERGLRLDHQARLRRQRDMHVGVALHGGRGTSFDRGTFLLAKQLLYFERYGKMFLGDTSLLADRAFFQRLLADGGASV